MNKVIWVFLSAFIFLDIAYASDFTITVQAGSPEALVSAIIQVNSGTDTDRHVIKIVPGPNGETDFKFTEGYDGTNNALPVIKHNVDIIDGRELEDQDQKFTLSGSGERDFRLLTIENDAKVFLRGAIEIKDFGVNGESGGAILANGSGILEIIGVRFENNFSNMNGGAIASTGTAEIFVINAEFEGNRASNLGGAISVQGQGNAVLGNGYGGSKFKNNQAGVFGCDINANTSGFLAIRNSIFEGGNCQNVLIENPSGRLDIGGNMIEHAGNAIDSTDFVSLFGNIFQKTTPPSQVNAVAGRSSKPQATCNDFGTGAFISNGYNISTEDGCSLDQVTDQPNTDPMISINESGLPVVDTGSPAIDAGSAEVVLPDVGNLAVLPCGYVDVNGVARPQDGNGDGMFECDPGVSEFVGPGMVEAGHSGAFYNGLRNGEGTYVEILNDSLAVVYTFTYRPDGSGPSWFVGVGDIRDNGIVIDELLRPIGTSFGSDFDPAAIDFSDAGGMSMVFPDCAAGGLGGLGGSVAYTGHEGSGYEGVLSRAQRLTSITGCTTIPTANAGLSGSFYDPARNGEGLIIEWLESGDVLAIFFTFDLNGDQFWTFGIGTPSGKSVTIEALYPSEYTSWGRGFNADDVLLQSWGTFNLNWTDCDNLGFSYNSTVPEFGNASRDYTRISSLQGTSCPGF